MTLINKPKPEQLNCYLPKAAVIQQSERAVSSLQEASARKQIQIITLDAFLHLDQNTPVRGTAFTWIYLTLSELELHTQQLESETFTGCVHLMIALTVDFFNN